MTSSSEQTAHTLMNHSVAEGIYINPCIHPRSVTGAGLGIYATSKLKAGDKVIQVPTKHVFTTKSIPTSFLDEKTRQGLSVHVQLATFFAFASDSNLEQYQSWIATWPSLSDFTDTMPLFWGQGAIYIQQQLGRKVVTKSLSEDARSQKRRRVSIANSTSTYAKSTVADQSERQKCLGFALNMNANGSGKEKSSSLTQKMADKLVKHVTSLDHAMPYLGVIKDDIKLAKFLHAWCLVNTRCFYYDVSKPGRKNVRLTNGNHHDPDDAMALCPFMDLFNHRAPDNASNANISVRMNHGTNLPCKVQYTTKGFTVTSRSAITADSEILLSYGAHSNDTLWCEYGFILPGDSNSSDWTHIDEVVLKDFKATDLKALDEYDYRGNYALDNDGAVCYRTEMAAWLSVLGEHAWSEVVGKGQDPEEHSAARKVKIKFKHILRSWLKKLVQLANESTDYLQALDHDQLQLHFFTMLTITTARPESESEQIRVMERRRRICLERWKQISDMATRGISLYAD